MNDQDFNKLFSLTFLMRQAQKAYFKERSQATLIKAKEAESKVDACLADIVAQDPKRKEEEQGSLFA